MLPSFCIKTKRLGQLAGIVFLALAALVRTAWGAASGNDIVFTNVTQLRAAPPEVFLSHCAIQLSGIVTLIDTNRELLVLQTESGPVALNPAAGLRGLEVRLGQKISVDGSDCSPYFVTFPNYPYQPTTNEIRSSFEAPAGLGPYYLTRMRGYLHPPVSGEYTFWIASDNSSQLWLSSNTDPRKAKRIAFITRYNWVNPREWSHYPSQRSETIYLQAGQSYFIEAFHEQTSGDDHLAVAWQGPSQKQSVIDGAFLSPWVEPDQSALNGATNGILREFWQSFSSGDLDTLSGLRPFDSILSVKNLKVTARNPATAPKPLPITVSQQLRPEEKFSWVEIQGEVTFAGDDERSGFIELSDGEAQVPVRVLGGDAASLRGLRNSIVRVTGVCEAVYDLKNTLVPGTVWVSQNDGISVIQGAKSSLPSPGQSSKSVLTNENVPMGFYNAHGVVTFNDRVFGNDIMFVQEDNASVYVSLKDIDFRNRFEIGRWVELGGDGIAGKNIPAVSPLTITELGWRTLPVPMPLPVQSPILGNRDGKWTEVEGIVHAVNSDGTVTVSDAGGLISAWIGKTGNAGLKRLVDAKVRLRGVLSLSIQDSPLLLVPSSSFVEVEEEPASDPFAMAFCSVSNVFSGDADMALSHRIKLKGTVTLGGGRSFVVQDGLVGVRVESLESVGHSVGQSVEVVGFPGLNGSTHTLTSALVRSVGGVQEISPRKLDAGDVISFRHSGSLVQVTANLIAQHTKGGRQMLELQEKQRVFEAELPIGLAELPLFEPGSRLQVSGVCDFVAPPGAASAGSAAESPSIGALKIWLRNPADVTLLSGPPWWTWKYTTGLVGALLLAVAVSLLRNNLLHRRLERHLELSRQILESQESERHRIAANLHDSLGQNLLVIKNQARLAMQPVAETVLRHRLDEISQCASEAIAEVREITYALRPYQLDRLGLTQTIRATVNRAAENSTILFASHADDVDGMFDKESEIHVYRIVQEAVNNILKHSGATEATVVVKKLGASASLSIRDNGRGFDPEAVQNSESEDVGHGLNGIKERVRILSGTFAIESQPGQGTTLTVEIPIHISNHAIK
jgi:signal transduction histidine kinase